MPVGFNSPARNLFLLGSSGAQVVSNFFESISKASTTDGVFIPDESDTLKAIKNMLLLVQHKTVTPRVLDGSRDKIMIW